MISMLVLASASPRRQELLRNAGLAFEVQPANIPERVVPGEDAKKGAERRACGKALPGGPPAARSDAARLLRILSGRDHEVITGVCLVFKGQSFISSETA